MIRKSVGLDFNFLTSWFFFGGLSIHLTTAILAHLFSYNMTWGATKKVLLLLFKYGMD